MVVCIYWIVYILLESVQLVDCACLNRCMLIIDCVLFDYDPVYDSPIDDYVVQHDMTRMLCLYPFELVRRGSMVMTDEREI